MNGVTGGIAWQPNDTWLPTTAMIDGPPPAYGTVTRLVFESMASRYTDRWGTVPAPGVATLLMLGSRFARAIMSATDLTGRPGCVYQTWVEAASTDTGMKLLYTSYGTFL
jgi:hypothetical protein